VLAAGLLLVGLAVAGCDDLLDVEPPDRVQADEILRPQNAETLLSGVIADFDCAYAGYASWTASLGDEFLDGGSADNVERRGPIRTEVPSNWASAGCESGSLFIPISVARWSADNLLRHLEEWTDDEVPGRTRLLATTAAYSGYAHLFLAEGMCRAAFDGGPALSSDEVFFRAEERFTRAIEAASEAGAADLLALARLGRARARLGLARVDGVLVDPEKLRQAGVDARGVPDGFVWLAEYSTVSPRTENHVWSGSGPGAERALFTVGEPYRDAAFDGVADPRLPVVDTGEETDQAFGIPFWQQQKYTSRSDPIELATWEEAQLIVAEAELEAGNLQAAVEVINELHRRVGLPDTFASTERDEIFAQLIYERRAELFLEGRHLGDARRYDLPFSPPVGSETPRGQVYGDARCFPLPDNETQNNPNVSG